MGMIALICPACGASIQMEEGRDSCFCQYCGAQVVKNKQYVEVSGNVSVEGVASESSLLKRAFLFIEDKDFDEASKYLDRVLDINPENPKAYIGKVLCMLTLTDEKQLENARMPLHDDEDFRKALRFARGDELARYQAFDAGSMEKRDADLKAAIGNAEQDANRVDAEYEKNKQQFEQDQDGGLRAVNTWTIVMVISITVALVFFIICGTTGAGWTALIMIAAAVVGFVSKRKMKKSTEELKKIQSRVDQVQKMEEKAKFARQHLGALQQELTQLEAEIAADDCSGDGAAD